MSMLAPAQPGSAQCGRRSPSGTARRAVALLLPVAVGLLASAAARAGLEGSADPCPGAHTFTFVNDCDYAVWLAELGNSAGSCTSDSQCLQDPAGLQFCDIPQCSGATDCPTISCESASDCPLPSEQSCTGKLCTPACQSGGGCACNESSGCPGGGVCSGGICSGGLCQYTTIVPASWEIQHAQSAQLCIPKGWGGRFWGRTGCTQQDGGLSCRTGQCGPPYPATGELECTSSGNAPMTLFEPTLDTIQGVGIVDFYDVSLVSGYNVPLEVKPSSSGCVVTGACTSDLNETCPTALQVTGPACTQGECPLGGFCVDDVCVVGCLDPCDACGASSPPAELDCMANMDFYCCGGAQASNSCNSASATCFDDRDCQNLSNGVLTATCDTSTNLCMRACTKNADCPSGTCDTAAGQCAPPLVSCASEACPMPPAPQPAPSCDMGLLGGVCVPQSDCCGPYNASWTQAAETAGGGSRTWTSIFKQACPTAYSYQFDDPTSTFTCLDPAGGELDYQITFCPRPVPEPSGWLLAGASLVGLWLLRGRARASAARSPSPRATSRPRPIARADTAPSRSS